MHTIQNKAKNEIRISKAVTENLNQALSNSYFNTPLVEA
jgi:hypothetical protein